MHHRTYYLHLISNCSVRILLGIAAFISIPLSLKIAGVESYGVIGLFNILSSFFLMFDFGWLGALNREVAILSTNIFQRQKMLDLIRTVEVLFWIFSLLMGIMCITCSDIMIHYWIKNYSISPTSLYRVLMLMSVALTVQTPFAIYSNTLLGLGKQIPINFVILIFGLLRQIGGLYVLFLMKGALESYFIYQCIINILQIYIAKRVMKYFLSDFADKSKFNWGEIQSIKKYASGLFFISLLSFFIIYIDKIILLHLLDLKSFGYYVAIYNLSSVQMIVYMSIFTTYFPKLSQLASNQEIEALRQVYYFYFRLSSILFFPLALILIVFSKEVISLWIKDEFFMTHLCTVFRFIAAGNLFCLLLSIISSLSLAYGKTRYLLRQTLTSLILFIPLCYILTLKYGMKGTSMAWFLNHAFLFFLMAPLYHREFLKEKFSISLFYNILYPFFISLFVIILAKLCFRDSTNPIIECMELGTIGVVSIIATSFSIKELRIKVLDLVYKTFKHEKI